MASYVVWVWFWVDCCVHDLILNCPNMIGSLVASMRSGVTHISRPDGWYAQKRLVLSLFHAPRFSLVGVFVFI